MRSLPLHLAALTLFCAAAYWAGKQSAPEKTIPAPRATVATTAAQLPKAAATPAVAATAPATAAEALKAELLDMLRNGQDNNITRKLEELTKLDAPAAWEVWLAWTKEGMRDPRGHWGAGILKRLAETDPDKALALGFALAEGERKHHLMADLCQFLVTRSPEQGFAPLLAHPEARSAKFLAIFAEKWAMKDPAFAVAHLDTLPAGPLRTGFIKGFGLNWMMQNPEGFSTWFKALPERDAYLVLDGYPSALSHPGWSLTQVKLMWDTLPDGKTREGMMPNIGGNFLPQNREQLLALFQDGASLGDERLNRILGKRWLSEFVSKTDFATSLPLLTEVPSELRNLCQELLVSKGLHKDQAAVFALIENIPETDRRDELMTKALRQMATGRSENIWFHTSQSRPNPALALELATSHPQLLAGPKGNELTQSLLQGGANPATVASLAVSVESPEKAASQAETVARTWASNDPFSCIGWIEKLPGGTVRDNAVAGLGQSLFDSDPASALAWTATVEDEKLRSRTNYSLLQRWADSSPQGVVDWLATHPEALAPEQRGEIEARLKRNPSLR